MGIVQVILEGKRLIGKSIHNTNLYLFYFVDL